MIDVLHGDPNTCLVYLSPKAMPKSVLKFWEMQTEDSLETAARNIVDTTVLPKALMDRKQKFYEPVKRALHDRKVRILVTDKMLNQIVEDEVSTVQSSSEVKKFASNLNIDSLRQPITKDNVASLLKKVDNYQIKGQNTARVTELRDNLRVVLRAEMEKIDEVERIRSEFTIKEQDMIDSLNAAGKKSLYIIQDNNDASVRRMSHKLGKTMLKRRREMGRISPLVSFIYDEADLFIAQQGEEAGMKESKSAAQELARRGRKYGLGIGIATQRIVYLDTNILGQPHTYLVSKLPRAKDRETIQAAFGLSDETLSESLRFGPGQWLLISHSATGVDGLPIPIQIPNANDRIAKFLDSFDGAWRT